VCVQPFSQKSRTPTVAKEFQIGLYDPAEADFELFCNSCSAGFLGERLYVLCLCAARLTRASVPSARRSFSSASLCMIIDPIWHPMEMHFLSAGYEHRLPPNTTAHVDQRPQMSSRRPRSTDDTHFVASSHVELPPAASPAGHLFHKKAFKTTVGCKEKRLSLKPNAVAA